MVIAVNNPRACLMRVKTLEMKYLVVKTLPVYIITENCGLD